MAAKAGDLDTVKQAIARTTRTTAAERGQYHQWIRYLESQVVWRVGLSQLERLALVGYRMLQDAEERDQ